MLSSSSFAYLFFYLIKGNAGLVFFLMKRMKVLGSAEQKNNLRHGHCPGTVNVTVYCSARKCVFCFLRQLLPSISVGVYQRAWQTAKPAVTAVSQQPFRGHREEPRDPETAHYCQDRSAGGFEQVRGTWYFTKLHQSGEKHSVIAWGIVFSFLVWVLERERDAGFFKCPSGAEVAGLLTKNIDWPENRSSGVVKSVSVAVTRAFCNRKTALSSKPNQTFSRCLS